MSNKKKNRKQARQEKFGGQDTQKTHFQLRHVSPLTPNQESTFKAYHHGNNIVCHGFAGTGKTYVSMFLALNEVLSGQSVYEKIVIIRSVVPSRDMGFLPGSMAEKARVYEEPYKEICDDLFGRGDGYDILKMRGLVQFTTTSFLRGVTFKNAIVVLDEAQNLNFGELYTTLTRMGDTSRLILCGDFRQTDLKKHESNNSLNHMMNVLKRMNNVSFIEFTEDDIVRSAFVKEFIIKSTEYQDSLGYSIT